MPENTATVGTGTRRGDVAGVVICVLVLGCAMRMGDDTEGSTGDVEGLCTAAVGEDAEVANAVESAWQGVEQEAANERLGGDGGDGVSRL